MNLDLTHERVCVTGSSGFVGQHVVQILKRRGLPEESLLLPLHKDFDLTDEQDVQQMFAELRPSVVIHLAALVGGIGANRSRPGEFCYANLAMGLHLIEQARIHHVQRFVHVGTVCSYPKFCPTPFSESQLWDGYPEESNAPYGIAKKALIVLLDSYRRQYGFSSAVVLPTNLYGPHDNFNEESSHVIPALIRKMIHARSTHQNEIEIWGSGKATREFLYVADAAEGIVRAAERIDDPSPINLGSGQVLTIQELVGVLAKACRFNGNISWNATYPDGQPQRHLDSTRATQLLDWKAGTSLEKGLATTVEWYCRQIGFQK